MHRCLSRVNVLFPRGSANFAQRLMKNSFHLSASLTSASLILALMPARPSLAQETTVREKSITVPAEGISEATTTTTTGTINDFGRERIVVHTESSPVPVAYTCSKTTTYVDEAGAPVPVETVKSGLPVIIHFAKEGDTLVARKVVVKKRTGLTAAADSGMIIATGTIKEVAPDAFVVRTESSATPFRYKFTKATTYFDAAGNAAAFKSIKPGLLVTVFYTATGDDMVATKVMLRKPAATGTTIAGTVKEINAERILIRTEASPDPVTCSFTKTTMWVDEAGAAVSADLIKSGSPVTVHYSDDGGSRVATKVVVRKESSVRER
jgi:hypothetical protein